MMGLAMVCWSRIRRYAGVSALLATMVALWLPLPAAALSSTFLANDAAAAAVAAGAPYDMNDPNWRDGNYRQNRGIFAYKIYSALIMLGYQAANYQPGAESVTVFRIFQERTHCNVGAVSSLLKADCLAVIDQQLVQREQLLASIAAGFPLYGRMQALAANDVSLDAVAAMYWLPMSVLPASLQMNYHETLQCLAGQCNGFIHDAAGNNIPGWPVPIDPARSDYFFVGAYFDPFVSNSQMVSAAVTADTVLHEFAHYIDGFIPWTKDPLLPHIGVVDNAGFYDILYDINDPGNRKPTCVRKRSQDIKDWISLYGYSNYSNCAAGYDNPIENWAEAFAMYVTAGRDFRAATLHSNYIAQEYDWLKTHVFAGVEFDTNLAQGYNSGCNDVPGAAARQPAYMHCDGTAVWDFTLPHDLVDGVCGAAGGGGFVTAPADNLCAAGAPSLAAANGSNWSWTCRGLNGGSTAQCSASLLTGNPPGAPTAVLAAAGNTAAVVTFVAPADAGDAPISGYVVRSSPAGGIDADAGSTALTHTVVGLANHTAYTFTVVAHNLFGDGPSSLPSATVTPAWSLVAESFDATSAGVLPAGWQSVHQTQNTGAWAVNAGGNYPAGVAAYSGSNLVYFNSHTAAAGATENLITSAFSLVGIDGAKLGFWMYRDDDASVFMTSDTVTVYLNSSASLVGATNLLTVARSRWQAPTVSTGGWYHYTAVLPADAHAAANYLIFSGSSQHGNDIYIDDILVATPPDAPAVADVVGGNAQALVTISPPLNDGGSAVTGYTVVSNPAGGTDSNAGSATLTHLITGLSNGTSYTFTVTAANVVGTSAASPASSAVVPLTLPAAPTTVVAVPGNKSATVTFSAPADDGGSAIIGYQVLADPADGVDTSAGTTSLAHTVIGLKNGTAYTFTATAMTMVGAGAPSSPSAAVIPAPDPTTVTLNVQPNPSVFGQAVSLTATVVGSGLTGTVDFMDASPPSPTALWPPHGLTGNQAQILVDGLSVGSHPLVASYAGDDNNAASTSATVMLEVGKADVQVAITSHLPSPVFVARSITVDATVLAAAPGSGYPSGTVTIGDGVDSCQFVIGVAGGCSLTLTTAGVRNLVAHYAGDGQFNPGDSAGIAHTVNPPTLPDKPVIIGGASSRQTLTVSFSAPISDGGADITTYQLSCVLQGGGGPATASGAASPLVLGGLVDGESYLCAVSAANPVGTGPSSDAVALVPGVRRVALELSGHVPEPATVGQTVTLSARVGPATKAIGLAAGGGHSCLLDALGGVRCWGRNDRGQLGDGSLVDRPLPIVVSGLPGAASAVAAGGSHACAVVGGGVWCWGDNGSGQLGQGLATVLSAAPVSVPGIASAVSVHAGQNFTCAIDTAGTVACWGDNSSGALGNGLGGTWPSVSTVPVAVDFSSVTVSGGIIGLGGGWGHACAIDASGGAFCWGANNVGQLGDNSTATRLRPVAVALPADFGAATAIAVGFEHSCALSDAGAVGCWGGNDYDQLASAVLPGNLGYSPVPVLIPDLPGVIHSLSAGFFGTCAADDADAVRCWGMASFVPTGGSMLPLAVPMAGFAVASLAGGDNHVCALAAEGSVACWGNNGFGQLGDAGQSSRASADGVKGFELPGGSLHFSDGVSSCDAILPATSCGLAASHAGTAQLTVSYSGDANYGPADSSPVGHVVQAAVQVIAFGPAPVVAAGGSGQLTAAGGNSGNPVFFSALTPATCGVTGNQVAGLQPGLCTVVADQAGNADYLAAPTVTQSFQIVAAAPPGQPTIFRLVPGKGRLKVFFTLAAGLGGVPTSDVVARCLPAGSTPPVVAHGLSSPLLLTGLVDGLRYTCTVHAANAAGSGQESAAASVLVRAPAIAPLLHMLLR